MTFHLPEPYMPGLQEAIDKAYPGGTTRVEHRVDIEGSSWIVRIDAGGRHWAYACSATAIPSRMDLDCDRLFVDLAKVIEEVARHRESHERFVAALCKWHWNLSGWKWVPVNGYDQDLINKPSHYIKNGIEVRHVIAAFKCTYNVGTAVAYLLRARFKGTYEADVRKAAKHLEFEIEALEASPNM